MALNPKYKFLSHLDCSDTGPTDTPSAREGAPIQNGIGYTRGSKIERFSRERFYREVRVNAIGDGAEEIMCDLAARQYQL